MQMALLCCAEAQSVLPTFQLVREIPRGCCVSEQEKPVRCIRHKTTVCVVTVKDFSFCSCLRKLPKSPVLLVAFWGSVHSVVC